MPTLIHFIGGEKPTSVDEELDRAKEKLARSPWTEFQRTGRGGDEGNKLWVRSDSVAFVEHVVSRAGETDFSST